MSTPGKDEPQTLLCPNCVQPSGIRATYANLFADENLFADDLTCKNCGAQVEVERKENMDGGESLGLVLK